MIENTTKRCTKCHEVKPLIMFNRHTRQKDGHDIYCKACRAVRWAERYIPHPRPKQVVEAQTDGTFSIPLTRGYFAIIDAVDGDLASFKWHTRLNKGGSPYAVREVSEKFQRMHRVILERKLERSLDAKEYPDHIDGNGLNNRRDNLRLSTKTQNSRNCRLSSKNTSGFKGVHYRPDKRKWDAKISVNNKTIFLGYFDTPEEASDAYHAAAIKYFGEFARFE